MCAESQTYIAEHSLAVAPERDAAQGSQAVVKGDASTHGAGVERRGNRGSKVNRAIRRIGRCAKRCNRRVFEGRGHVKEYSKAAGRYVRFAVAIEISRHKSLS